MNLRFNYTPPEDSGREAYRAAVPGLVAMLSGFSCAFPILDISYSGMAIKMDEIENLTAGQEAVIEILSASRKKIMRSSVRLVHLNKEMNVAGFEFIDLTPLQEASLDKLVLEVQKRQIQRQRLFATSGSKEDKKE